MNCVFHHPLKFEGTPPEHEPSRDHACTSYFFSDTFVEWTCIFLEKKSLAEFKDFGLNSFIFVLEINIFTLYFDIFIPCASHCVLL